MRASITNTAPHCGGGFGVEVGGHEDANPRPANGAEDERVSIGQQVQNPRTLVLAQAVDGHIDSTRQLIGAT